MRISTLLTVILAILVAAVIAVANRGPVTFSLDPFSASPALAFTMPLYLLVFFAVFAGVMMGGFTVWLRRARRARTRHAGRVGENALDPLEPPAPRGDSPAQ